MTKRNAVHCLTCDTVIESKHRHDFVGCKCPDGTWVGVDGGQDYQRIVWDQNAKWEPISDEDA